jgi:hypothetical protein
MGGGMHGVHRGQRGGVPAIQRLDGVGDCGGQLTQLHRRLSGHRGLGLLVPRPGVAAVFADGGGVRGGDVTPFPGFPGPGIPVITGDVFPAVWTTITRSAAAGKRSAALRSGRPSLDPPQQASGLRLYRGYPDG